MKIKLEIDKELENEEIIIKCKYFRDEIDEIQKMLEEKINSYNQIEFFKEDTQYYLSIKEILFFETSDNRVYAHTVDDIYKVKYKLYELEGMLSKNFIRVSKSTIINIEYVYAITKNIASPSLVQFQNTEKKIYVSRSYYKNLKERLSEKRM